MKKILLLPILLLFFCSFKTQSVTKIDNCRTIEVLDSIHYVKQMELNRLDSMQRSLNNFKMIMSKLETGNLPNKAQIVNKFGYAGKYQFGQKTLKGLIKTGYLDATYEDIKIKNFINNEELQEKAMEALISHNTKILKNYNVLRFEGKKINGVKITKQGMLAAAHLRGPNAVKLFVESGGKINKVDGNGTSVLDYIKQFENA